MNFYISDLHFGYGNVIRFDNRPIGHISDEGRSVILCHYPMAEWPGYYKDSWHIYGHIHNKKMMYITL